jgi:hypothetical protein
VTTVKATASVPKMRPPLFRGHQAGLRTRWAHAACAVVASRGPVRPRDPPTVRGLTTLFPHHVPLQHSMGPNSSYHMDRVPQILASIKWEASGEVALVGGNWINGLSHERDNCPQSYQSHIMMGRRTRLLRASDWSRSCNTEYHVVLKIFSTT